MAQSTTNLGKIHVFPSESLYNQFKDIIADNDLALLKDDGAYIVAALLEQNGYVKFSNGLILQWGFGESPYATPTTYTYPLAYSVNVLNVVIGSVGGRESTCRINSVSKDSFVAYRHYSGSGTGSGDLYWLAIGV